MSVKLDDRVLRDLIRTAGDELDTWLGSVSFEILGEIVTSFGQSPSAPGEPPGVDTGALRDSMGQERLSVLQYVVYARAEYAPYLEFGTTRLAKRPYFTPVFEAWRRRKLADSAKRARLLER